MALRYPNILLSPVSAVLTIGNVDLRFAGVSEGYQDTINGNLADSADIEASQYARDVTAQDNAIDYIGASFRAGNIAPLPLTGRNYAVVFDPTTSHVSLTFDVVGSDSVSGARLETQGMLNATDFSIAPDTAVPEPSSWAMLLAGFGMVGSALRTRRRNTARA